MKSRRNLGILIILLFVLALGMQALQGNSAWINLGPIPYEMKIPRDLAGSITVEDQSGDTDSEFTQQAFKDGAKGYVTLTYQSIDGEENWFMGAYYFSESDYAKVTNPDEVPPYGFKVLAKDGMVLSVVGPQESIFAPGSIDGENFRVLYDLLYERASYRLVK
jgi:hypothetical protein